MILTIMGVIGYLILLKIFIICFAMSETLLEQFITMVLIGIDVAALIFGILEVIG